MDYILKVGILTLELLAWKNQNLLVKVAAAAGGEVVLIPFCEDICYRIEPSLKQVWINPPEGLLELNAI